MGERAGKWGEEAALVKVKQVHTHNPPPLLPLSLLISSSLFSFKIDCVSCPNCVRMRVVRMCVVRMCS